MKKFPIIAAVAAALGLAANTASAAFIELGEFGTGSNATTGISQGNVISQDQRWTRDNVYILKRVIYVVPPAVLTIEPGTVIRGVNPKQPTLASNTASNNFAVGSDSEPGTLVISRGAKIIANGTPDDPIVMTSLGDPYVIGGAATIPATVNGVSTTAFLAAQNYAVDGSTSTPATDPNGGATNTKQNAQSIDQEWGGLIVLGQSPIGYDADNDTNFLAYDPVANSYSGDTIVYPNGVTSLPSGNDVKGGNGVGIALIEGLILDPATLTGSYTEPFPGATNVPAPGTIIGGVYGGLTRTDNSGIVSFVSSRFGGFKIGTDNEINGITFGGVGSGTVLEWSESYNNGDDGLEFFGGFVNPRFVFSLFAGDDGLDGDQGFNGNTQFGFVIANNASQARSGFGSNNSATGRIAANNSDTLFEWDGSEDNDKGVTPNTDEHFTNFTGVHGTVAGRDGARSRRSVAGNWRNGIFQDVPDLAHFDESPNFSGSNVDGNVYSNVTTASGNIGSNAVVTSTAQILENGHNVFEGLDPRLTASSAASALTFAIPAQRSGSYPFSGLTPVSFAGAMRDNNMLSDWSILSYIDILNPGNVDRPAVSLATSGGNASISFPADTNEAHTVVYSVEVSTNRKNWSPIAVVQDNVTGLNSAALSAAGYNTVSTDSNGTAGSITVVDTVSGALTGTPRFYRVIPM